METAIPRDQLLHLLQHTFGPKVRLLDCQIGNEHHDYLVLLVRLDRPSIQIVVKLAGPQASMASPFDRTAMLHRLVAARTTIPMPEVLAVSMSCQAWPWRYLIKMHVPGQEWAVVRRQMSREDLAGAYRQIGDAVAQLHAIHFPAFGELDVDGAVRGGGPYLAALAERSRLFVRSARLRDLFLSVLDEHKDLFSGVRQASLCHEDLHQHNILFDCQQGQWRLVTILDFDKAWAGHHEIDLARLDLWTGMTSDEFWSSYEATCPPEPSYEQRRPIYQLLWCFEYAQSTAQHLADTRRLCAELGLEPFERFD